MHIKVHYPLRTISDVCALPELHCDQVHLFSIIMIPESCSFYQNITAPYHTCRIVWDWFELHSREFQVLSWSPKIQTNIYPVEHVWFHMELPYRCATLPLRNVRKMQDQLVSAWYQMFRLPIRTISCWHQVGCWWFWGQKVVIRRIKHVVIMHWLFGVCKESLHNQIMVLCIKINPNLTTCFN